MGEDPAGVVVGPPGPGDRFRLGRGRRAGLPAWTVIEIFWHPDSILGDGGLAAVGLLIVLAVGTLFGRTGVVITGETVADSPGDHGPRPAPAAQASDTHGRDGRDGRVGRPAGDPGPRAPWAVGRGPDLGGSVGGSVPARVAGARRARGRSVGRGPYRVVGVGVGVGVGRRSCWWCCSGSCDRFIRPGRSRHTSRAPPGVAGCSARSGLVAGAGPRTPSGGRRTRRASSRRRSRRAPART